MPASSVSAYRSTLSPDRSTEAWGPRRLLITGQLPSSIAAIAPEIVN
jgi:hypothetical protein